MKASEHWSRGASTWKRAAACTPCAAVVYLCLGAALTALLLWRGMALPLSHDEHMYIAAGRLVAERQVPYRDFPFFQMPYLPYVYAGLFSITNHLLAAGRCFSVFCSLAVVLLLARACLRMAGPGGATGKVFAVLAVTGLSVFNPLFNYAGFWAWNHSPAVLLLLAAYGVQCRGGGRGMACVLSGLLVGLSAGMRLTMILAVVPFVFAMEGWGLCRHRMVQLAKSCLLFAAGLLVGLFPMLLVFTQAPANTMFDNMGYHVLNAQLIADPLAGWCQRKTIFLLHDVLAVPGNLLLVLCVVVFTWMRRHRIAHADGRQKELVFAGAIAWFMVLGALVPDPPQLQYFFPILPFAIIVAMGQLASLPPDKQAYASKALSAVVLLTVLFGLPAYRFLWNARAPHDWIPLNMHKVGERIAECAAGARVITIAPAHVLEGGGRIPVQCAAGSFGWRVGALLDEGARQRLRIAAPNDLEKVMTMNAPAVLLTGTERPNEEKMFLDYVKRQGWGSRPIDKKLTLHGASF